LHFVANCCYWRKL